jgi:hypothetical protein
MMREEAAFIASRLRRGGELEVFWELEGPQEIVIVGLPDGRLAWDLTRPPANGGEPVFTRSGRWTEAQLVAFLISLDPDTRYLFSSVRPGWNGTSANKPRELAKTQPIRTRSS